MNFMSSISQFLQGRRGIPVPAGLDIRGRRSDRHRAIRVPDPRNHSQSQPVGHAGAGLERRELQASGGLCTQNSKASIATILNYGVARVASARRRDDIEKAMDESLLEVIPRIEKRTHYLSSLANVGLLIGLLGTITGLIGAFSAVATANPAEKASLLAAAISVAMNNTASGLVVAITLLLCAHVPRVEDHLADRQLGDRVGEVLELDHGAPDATTGACTGGADAVGEHAGRRPRQHLDSSDRIRMVLHP